MPTQTSLNTNQTEVGHVVFTDKATGAVVTPQPPATWTLSDPSLGTLAPDVTGANVTFTPAALPAGTTTATGTITATGASGASDTWTVTINLFDDGTLVATITADAPTP